MQDGIDGDGLKHLAKVTTAHAVQKRRVLSTQGHKGLNLPAFLRNRTEAAASPIMAATVI